MKNNLNQILLYKYRNEVKQSLSVVEIGRGRFKYLSKFLKNNKSLVIAVLFSLFFQTIIEIVLILLANNSLKNIFINTEKHNNLWFAYSILICCILYTFISFLAVRYERTLVLGLINDLRRKLFSLNLNKEVVENNYEKRAGLLTKLSYHLSLLTMGIDNTLLSTVRWLLYLIILIVFSLVNKGAYIFLIGVVFLASILLFLIAYFLSIKYISRQVASYSKIVRYISNVLFEMPLIKNLHKEEAAERKLDEIVNIDTYFRIIRDTLIRYSNRVVFILIISVGAIGIILTSHYPSLSLSRIDQFFLKGVFSIYIIRILYSSTKAGLYFWPLRLGIFLTIPENFTRRIFPRSNWNWQKISFKSNKVKLFKEGEYVKNVSLEFSSGGRYLFVGDYQSGKTHLAAIFSGKGYFSRHSWIVKVDKEHFIYNSWSELFKDNYFFLSSFSTNLTIGEIVLNKERENIKEEDIARIDALCLKYPIFMPVFSKTRFSGESAQVFESSPVSLFIIQTVYCILNKSKFIIIDNIWVDLCYNQIEDLIKILDKELPSSVIIVFSRNKNLIVSYKDIYEIKKSSIQKI